MRIAGLPLVTGLCELVSVVDPSRVTQGGEVGLRSAGRPGADLYTTVERREHVALLNGEIGSGHDVVVRVQSECVLAELLGSVTCGCRHELDAALGVVGRSARGAVSSRRRGPGDGE